jgi:hypothetical protein
VLSIICNTICLQFSLYRAPLQSLGLFLLISSRISDFQVSFLLKIIILVSNLKETSPSVFSWKKEYIKNYEAILLSKYDSAEKKIPNYAYVLKNGVGRRAIFIRPDSELIRESVCACAKLFVDEENVHMAQIESLKNKNIDGLPMILWKISTAISIKHRI